MSLFDIIKYRATDITSEDELLKLPEGLIDLYWDENKFLTGVNSYEARCFFLAAHADRHHRIYQKRFMKALKKYNP